MPVLKKFLIVLIWIIPLNDLYAQDSLQLTKTSKVSLTHKVIVDFNKAVLPPILWQSLLSTGEYGLKSLAGDTMIVYKLSEKDKTLREARTYDMPKPRESKSFYIGEKFPRIKTKDIYGNKINIRDLKGKIVVVNYWFINCPPCRMEIPELNKLATDYKMDSSVVFIAIALDNEFDIAEFINDTPFKYSLVADGKYLDGAYKINNYPTNVIIDKEGKVYYHAAGYGSNTCFWLKKSIEELKEKL